MTFSKQQMTDFDDAARDIDAGKRFFPSATKDVVGSIVISGHSSKPEAPTCMRAQLSDGRWLLGVSAFG